MEPTPHSKPRARVVRHMVFACFVGVPAVVFWLTASVVVLGILGAVSTSSDEYCNVARVPLHGVLTATNDGFSELLGLGVLVSADDLVATIREVDDDEFIDAIVIDVDSPGGTPVAADEVMQAIRDAKKPTVAVIRDLGTSAAYWAAAGADHIIASPVSGVGSIGVTMSYLELAGANEEEGSRWVDLSSGTFKDVGTPDRHLSEEEEEYLKGQVNTVHAFMVRRIAGVRDVISEDELAVLADGRAFLGREALTLKLIDDIGGFNEALQYLSDRLVKPSDDLVLCVPTRGSFTDFF